VRGYGDERRFVDRTVIWSRWKNIQCDIRPSHLHAHVQRVYRRYPVHSERIKGGKHHSDFPGTLKRIPYVVFSIPYGFILNTRYQIYNTGFAPTPTSASFCCGQLPHVNFSIASKQVSNGTDMGQNISDAEVGVWVCFWQIPVYTAPTLRPSPIMGHAPELGRDQWYLALAICPARFFRRELRSE